MSLWLCKDCRKMTWGSSLCRHCCSLNVEKVQGVKPKPAKTTITISPKSAFACTRCGSRTEPKITDYGDMRRCTNCGHEEEGF